MSQGTKNEVAGKAKRGAGVTRRTVLATAVAGLGAVVSNRSAEAAEEPELAVEASNDQRRVASEVGQRSPFEKSRTGS